MIIDDSWTRIGEFKLTSLTKEGTTYNLRDTLVIELYITDTDTEDTKVVSYRSYIHKLDLWVDAPSLEFTIRMVCDLIFKVRESVLIKEQDLLTELDSEYINLFTNQ